MIIEDRVTKLLEDNCGIISGQVNIDDTRESLGMDSLDDVIVIMAIEEEFDIEISDFDAEKLSTVKIMVDYVTSKI